jgi:hypothetical protein
MLHTNIQRDVGYSLEGVTKDSNFTDIVYKADDTIAVPMRARKRAIARLRVESANSSVKS